MHRNRIIIVGTPWWRGFMPRSYTAPHCVASFGCSVFLIVFGIFFILAGTVTTFMSKQVADTARRDYENPTFKDPFFKDINKSIYDDRISKSNTMHTVGIILISVGAIFIIAAISICCFAKYYVKRHENTQQNEGSPPLAGYCPPTLPQSYPQQPAPPPYSYPQYPVNTSGAYPPQYAPGPYPQQPVPQDSYPYPPTTHPATFDSQMPNNASAPPIGLKE